MAWVGGHFAIGMACGGVAAAGFCAWRRRDWRLVPAAMVAGGLWATVPDMPRVIREDLPGTWLAATAGAKPFEEVLQYYGNLFFFHRWLDLLQEGRWGLRGLAIVVACYTLLSYGLLHHNRALRHKVHRLKEQLLGAPRVASVSRQAVARTSRMSTYSRRRHERVASQVAINATVRHVLSQAECALDQPKLLNISEGGLAMTTPTAAEPGTLVSIQPEGEGRSPSEAVEAVVLERINRGDVFQLRCRNVGGKSPIETLQAA